MKIDLHHVQRTLLLPLWGRAKLTKAGNPVLTDPKAVEIVDQIADSDFLEIEKSFSDFYNVGWIVRAKMFDETIKDFLLKNPEASVVNLGAGLDTTFFRIDNGYLNWYDLDLPDVIEIRKKIIPETNRAKCIAQSLFDPGWMKEISTAGHPVLLLAGGVLFYFGDSVLKEWFKLLADFFPGGEIVFDTISERAIPLVNKGLQSAGFDSTLIQWGLSDGNLITQWDARISLIEDYPLFSRLENRNFWGKDIAGYMLLNDQTKGTGIVHLKFSDGTNS